MLEELNKRKAYHICLYPEYELKIGEEYNTNSICRNHSDVAGSKADIEAKFEEFRLGNCSSLPSRKTCFYICTDYTIDYWIRTLTKKTSGEVEYKVFEIELNGHVFWADSICFSEEDEKEYWKGCACDEHIPTEGLFTGIFVVLRECKA